MELLILFFVFMFGACIGSFINVCVSRLPAGLSVVTPPSRCPNCLSPIRYEDNIPVISYLRLRGKCRDCKQPISLRYPLVEFFSGVVALAFFVKWSAFPLWLITALASTYILIVVSLIDFDTMMIADIFSWILVAFGLGSSFINPYYSGTYLSRISSAVLGSLIGAGLIWGLAVLGRKIYKKDAVGEGDILLMAAIGSLTGWNGVVSSLIIASFFGSIYGLTLMLMKKAGRLDHMPFGPFLSAGAVINLYSLVRLEYFLFLPI